MNFDTKFAPRDLGVGPMVNFFTSRGADTLTPVGYYALMGTLTITIIFTLFFVLASLGSDERKEKENALGYAFAIAMIGAASIYMLLYVELYVFQTGAWMVLLPALIFGGIYLHRTRRLPSLRLATGRLLRRFGLKPARRFDQFSRTIDMPKQQATPIKANRATRYAQKTQKGSAMEKLYSLPGLTGTKEQVSNEIALQRTELLRARKGLRTNNTSRHMVFTGNPGTGKTTVARIIGEIYREMGLLKKGHFVEIGGRDLVAEWIGQTTKKVQDIVTEALDGILFIDEAYAMIPGDSFRDFGPEALAALIKFMEDYRDRLIVIMAGYGDEMDELLNKNPGLKSRMKTRIHFPDYAPDELATIFELQCTQQDYALTHDARERAKSLFTNMYEARDKDFGNGRSVRNAFERCIVKQARRLSDRRSPTKRELQTLYATDIPALDELDW